MIGFVDDKQHYTNQIKEIIIEKVITAMELSLSTWYEIYYYS